MRYLLIIVALLPVSSSGNAKSAADKAQTECVVSARLKYAEASVSLYQQQGLAPAIGDIVAKRRLLEAYCLQYVRCVNVPEIVMGVEFSRCLDDEDADRLKDGVK